MLLPYVLGLSALLVCAQAIETPSRFQPKNPRKAELPMDPAESDAMVNNFLQWLQGFYQQRTNNRPARQFGGGKPEKPRPFGYSYLPPTGYPPSGSRPTPSYNEGPAPSSPGYRDNYQPFQTSQSDFQSNQQTQTTYQPSQTSEVPYRPNKPSDTPYLQNKPSEPSYRPSSPSESPFQQNQPSEPSYRPNEPTDASYSQNQPSEPSYVPNLPSEPYKPNQASESSYQSGQSFETTYQTNQPSESSYDSSQSAGSSYQSSSSYATESSFQQPQPNFQTNPSPSSNNVDDDDDRHPPHIHDISVDCGKEMMTINIEFNKPYNGIIYSQDHYKESDCIYVRESSNQIKYSFTVSLNKCGTRFFSDFQNEGQAYLENVLVLQNEPGIQEVWDHIRRVRCLWEGNLTKQLVSSLSVGMLNQVVSNFSGDTAMARLDIQTGRGPFAPEANGLVKIGQTMTLVVTVTGDAGFDILVRECVARDANSINIVKLTDSEGCVLKPKLFGAFQKTRDTGNTGASIIAYAYFNAFKFPDEMDLVIQCEVELCKTDCDVCPVPGSTEPRRRRRDLIHYGNKTAEPSTTIGKELRVVFEEDLPKETVTCVSSLSMLWGGILVITGSLLSSILVSLCWQRSHASVKFM